MISFHLLSTLLVCMSVLPAESQPSSTAIDHPVDDKPLVVFLVRHAEKADAGRDPELSPAGVERSQKLAEILKDAGIEYIHSTDYIRTRSTAAPAAKTLGLNVEMYDPRDLPSLIASLRRSGGRHLVVGHSNTTPAVVKLLGGDAGPPIEESNEYDRLYIVNSAPGDRVSTVMLRYGGSPDSE